MVYKIYIIPEDGVVMLLKMKSCLNVHHLLCNVLEILNLNILSNYILENI